MSLQSHQNSTAALDSVVWGDRSKDDFNMLAQLQKVSFCLSSISIHESALLAFLAFRRLPRLLRRIWYDLEWDIMGMSRLQYSRGGLQGYPVIRVRVALAALSLAGTQPLCNFLVVAW